MNAVASQNRTITSLIAKDNVLLLVLFQVKRAFTKIVMSLCALTLFASSAHCLVYMWKDSAGIAHYTNKEYDIPDRYKPKVRALYPEATDARPLQQMNPAEQSKINVQQLPLPAQPAKPAEPLNVQPTVVSPLQKNVAPAAPARRGGRRRESVEE